MITINKNLEKRSGIGYILTSIEYVGQKRLHLSPFCTIDSYQFVVFNIKKNFVGRSWYSLWMKLVMKSYPGRTQLQMSSGHLFFLWRRYWLIQNRDIVPEWRRKLLCPQLIILLLCNPYCISTLIKFIGLYCLLVSVLMAFLQQARLFRE